MKQFLYLVILMLAFSATSFAQEKMEMEKAQATKADNIATFDKDGKILRGELLGKSKKVSLEKVMKNPEKYAEKSVRVEGVIVRSCKMEGCWMELAPNKDAKSVRVKFKDHGFFIPLESAGFKAKAEGIFSVKTLSKEEVDHLMNEDGAKFDNINEDGTVTEISFLASGVELTKSSE